MSVAETRYGPGNFRAGRTIRYAIARRSSVTGIARPNATIPSADSESPKACNANLPISLTYATSLIGLIVLGGVSAARRGAF